MLDREDDTPVLVCKAAVEEVFAVCSCYDIDGTVDPLDQSHIETAQQESAVLNTDGFRAIAGSRARAIAENVRLLSPDRDYQSPKGCQNKNVVRQHSQPG